MVLRQARLLPDETGRDRRTVFARVPRCGGGDAYRAVVAGGMWPDQVEERAPSKAAEPGAPRPDRDARSDVRAGPQHFAGEHGRRARLRGRGRARKDWRQFRAASPATIMADRIADVNQQIADWLKEIGGKITTDEQADRAIFRRAPWRA